MELGQVRSIDMVIDEKTGEVKMPVLIEVYPERLHWRSANGDQASPFSGSSDNQLRQEGLERLRKMVERGMRAQLRTGNLLSGQLYVALDFFPQAKPADLRVVGNDMVELPTVGNSLDEFQAQIAQILAKINKVPFDQIGRELHQTLAGMRRTVNEAEGTMKRVNRDLTPELLSTVQSLKKTLDSADRTLAHANRTLASDAPLQEDMQQTLQSVARAADSLKRLTDYLERHPESLIRGKTGK